MKSIRFFRLFTAILLFAAIQLNAGWIQKGDYLELDRKIPGTNVITFDETGDYFYTFSGDSCLRRWDRVSGEVVDSVKIKFNGRFTTCTFSSDKKVFCLVYTKDDFLKDYVYFDAYSVNSFKKLDSATITVGDPGGDHGYYVYNYFTKIDYSYFNQNFIIGHGFSQSSTTMGITDYSYDGSLFSLSGRDNKSTTLAEGFINTVNIYQDQNRSVYVTSRGYSSQQYDYDYLTVYISDSSFTTSQKILDYSQKSGSSSTYYKVKNAILNQFDSCIYFTSEDDKFLRTYDYSKKIYLKDYEMPATTSYWIYMSDDSRFLFLPYFNHLRILHPQTKTQIVEFNFDNDLISYGYNIENNGLISLTKSNTIELRYPKELVDSIDFKTSLMVTYQNVQISYFYSGIPKYKKYKWDFGDGKTSNEWLPTHSYSKTGEYSVKLTITDSLGIETTVIKDKFIRIIDTLVADFTILYQDPKDKHFVMFRDKTKGEVKTIKWDFGDGKIDSINNPVHRYEYEGFYKVTLFVSDEFSSDTISNIISVFDTPPSFCSDPNIRQVRYIKSITCRTSNGFVNLFKISNLGNYYLNYMYGYENNSCYGFQFTIFDKDLNQKYYNDNSTIKDFIFENNDENIRYFNNNSILIADKFLSKIDTVKSNIYFEYWYSDRYGNTFGLKKPSDDDWTLNKYNKFGNFIWSYIIPKYKSVPNIRTNENYVYFSFLNSYETYSKRYFHRLSNEGNLIDQFEIQELNWNRRNFHFDIITSQKSTSIYIVLTAFNDSTFIYKFDDQNKLIKSFQIKNFNFSAAKFINSDFSILGLIGKTAISGFMLIDTNLNIIYNRRFINLKNNIDNLALNERNEIVLVAPFFEEWYVTFNFITDTLPKWIIDKYLTSVQNPRLSNEIIQVLPNPASDDVEFILPEDPISGTFEIYNQQSQKVFSQNEVSDRLNLNTQIFPTGVYFCVFRTKDKVILQKFMVVH